MSPSPTCTRVPRNLLLAVSLLLVAGAAAAQNVATFASGVSGVKDFTWDAAGQVFATGQGGGVGIVYSIGPTGSPVSVLNNTFIDPWGVTFSSAGELYVADRGTAVTANDGRIYKVAANGTKTVFVTGLSDPMFIHFASNGDLYVAEWGARKMWKVSPAGVATLFTSNLGAAGDQVGDFVLEPNGDVLVGVGPSIVRLSPAGAVVGTVASGLNDVVGMTHWNSDDFYITRYSARDIWSVSATGAGSHWAGVGGTCTDGDLSVAAFGYTSGIHRRGNALFVGASSCNAIKVIDLSVLPTVHSTWGGLKSRYR